MISGYNYCNTKVRQSLISEYQTQKSKIKDKYDLVSLR